MAADRQSTPVPAIGYLRVSMKREEMISPQIQKTAISRAARQAGRRITAWVEDLDDTGRNFDRRVTQAIDQVESGAAREIWVYRYDRWGRTTLGSLVNVARVEHVGGQVVSATEPFDVETAVGKYSRDNAFALAQMQSNIIGENWKAAHASRRDRKLPGTGGPRFGYVRKGRVRREDNPRLYRADPDDPGERYETDPVTGPVLAEAYERYVAGEGAAALLRWINGTGARTARGATFGRRALFFVLDSGFGAGLLRIHDPDCRCGKNLNFCGRAAWIPGGQPPVIGPELWEKYLRRREETRTVPPRHQDPVYPLAGLVRCGTCKARLSISNAGGGRTGWAYRCPNWVQHRGCPGVWVQRRRVEEAVLAEIAKWAADIDAAAEAEAARGTTVIRAKTDTGRLQREIERIDKALAKSVRMQAMDETTPASSYEAARAGMLADRAAAERSLKAARAAADANTAVFLPAVAGVLESWDLLPAARLREMLRPLVRAVMVTRTGPRQPADIAVIPVWEEPGEE